MTANKTIPPIASDSRLSDETREMLVLAWTVGIDAITNRRTVLPSEWAPLAGSDMAFIFTDDPALGALADYSHFFLGDDYSLGGYPFDWTQHNGKYLYSFDYSPEMLGCFLEPKLGDTLHVSTCPIRQGNLIGGGNPEGAAEANFMMAYMALEGLKLKDSYSVADFIYAGLTISGDGRFINEASAWMQCRVLEVPPHKDYVAVLAEVEHVSVFPPD